jgi:hypothetical protein
MKVLYRCVQLSWYKYLLLYCPILLCENVQALLQLMSAIVLNCTAVCRLVVLYCNVQCTVVRRYPGTSTVPAVVLYCTAECSCPIILLFCCMQLSWYKYMLLYCILLLCVGFLVREPTVLLYCTVLSWYEYCWCLLLDYCTYCCVFLSWYENCCCIVLQFCVQLSWYWYLML